MCLVFLSTPRVFYILLGFACFFLLLICSIVRTLSVEDVGHAPRVISRVARVLGARVTDLIPRVARV